MDLPERYAGFVTDRSRLVIAAVLLATLVVGAGAPQVESGLTIAAFGGDSPEARAQDYVEANFSTGRADTTSMQVVVRRDRVLSKDGLLETIELQRTIVENATVAPTLAEQGASSSLASVVATAAIRRGAVTNVIAGPGPPSLAEQERALRSLSRGEVASIRDDVLVGPPPAWAPIDPVAYLPATDGAAVEADEVGATLVFVVQSQPGDADSLPADVVDAQLAARDVAAGADVEAFVFGAGIVDAESTAATGDSFAVISPVALVLMLAVLGVVYRDPIDVLLGVVGIALVLTWMGGFMGWAGIGVTQIIIAVPFLLIGLSVDYALHVVMRYREADPAVAGVRGGMARGLAGVVLALAATTFTTAVGFLSNAVSDIAAIRSFGLTSAAGIVSTFVVFAVLLPALKVEVDSLRSRMGYPASTRAFGTGEGPIARTLAAGAMLARRAPIAVVVVAVVLAAGGGAAGIDIETSIDQVDFLPRETPEWMSLLPGPFAPGEYHVRSNAIYLNENFLQQRESANVDILVRGHVTGSDALERIDAATDRLATGETTVRLAGDRAAITSPLTVIDRVAARNETVARAVAETDTDGDGVPDRNLARVYDALYAADPTAARAVVHRTEDGEYAALRLTVGVRGGADTGEITAEMREGAAIIAEDPSLSAIATGQPVVTEVVQSSLLRTLVETFLITLGIIGAFLALIFRRRYGTASLGLVTIVPVVLALAWILGTMWALEIPFNTETAIITSIAIGIGVDYAIHISERYVHERDEHGEPGAALRSAIGGTGGALLASAATTAGGFGVLILALVPSLQRFGLVTGITIVYAFLASVLVLPALLVLWERRIGPGGLGDPRDTGT